MRSVLFEVMGFPEPGGRNVSIRVLPLAMNDPDCSNFLCFSDSVDHGYGDGRLHTKIHDPWPKLFDIAPQAPQPTSF